MAHDVFLSYATPDRNRALAVVAALEIRAIRCWVAPCDVVPGTEYGKQFIDALKSSRVMVLIFSTDMRTVPRMSVERLSERRPPRRSLSPFASKTSCQLPRWSSASATHIGLMRSRHPWKRT